jgi:hypothetical protein
MTRLIVALVLGASLTSNAISLTTSGDADKIADAIQDIRRAIEAKDCKP